MKTTTKDTKTTKVGIVRISSRVIGGAIEVDRHVGRVASPASFSVSFVLFVFFVVKSTVTTSAPNVAGQHPVTSGVRHSARGSRFDEMRTTTKDTEGTKRELVKLSNRAIVRGPHRALTFKSISVLAARFHRDRFGESIDPAGPV